MPEPARDPRLFDAWFARHPFEVLRHGLDAVGGEPDPEAVPRLERRYRRIVRRGTVAVRVRSVALALFYLAAIASVAGGIGGLLGRFPLVGDVFSLALATSAAFSVVFGLTAAALNRYIGVLGNRLLLLAFRLQGARG